MKKKLTISDIAKMSGVSKTAVSFILNGHDGVSEETRKKVQKIIEENNYKPLLNSRRLILKKSFTVAVVFDKSAPIFDNMFYFGIMGAMMKRCAHYDYTLIYSQYTCTENDVVMPACITEHDIDGLIFLKEIPPMLISKVISLEIPFVVVDDHTDLAGIYSVRVDYQASAYAAIDYLIKNGHQKIGFVGNTKLPAFYTQMQTGFQNVLRDNKISINPEYIFDNIYDNISLNEYIPICKDELPTAFFCMEDMLAIHLIKHLQNHGINVPNDISIISVDNIFLAEHITPSLTTVEVNMELMGTSAIDIIIALINSKPIQSKNISTGNLIIRESVKIIK